MNPILGVCCLLLVSFQSMVAVGDPKPLRGMISNVGQEKAPSPIERTDSSCNLASNVVFGELGGNGLMVTANYERFIGNHVGIRAGFGGAMSVTVPFMISVYIGSGANRMEIGAGYVFTPVSPFEYGQHGLATMTIGYRRQPREGGLMFRIGWTPYYDFSGEVAKGLVGVGVGYAF